MKRSLPMDRGDVTRPAFTLGVEELEAIVTAAVERALRAHVPPPITKAADRLTLAEAATELRRSQRQVRRLVAAGRLHVIKLREGGSARVLVARAELDLLVREATR